MGGSVFVVVLLTGVHLVAGRLRFLDRVPRSRWLSFAGGVSVAYVFVHLLPEIAEGHRRLVERGTVSGDVALYVVVLAGLVAYYVLERVVRSSERTIGIFYLHVGAFATYNAVIGYVVARQSEPPLLFGIAMALHFLVTDYGLQKNHGHAYTSAGRWIVSGAIVAGWAAGFFIDLLPEVRIFLVAVLAGGIILNVMKEELPEERRSRIIPFVTGAAGYAALLVVA